MTPRIALAINGMTDDEFVRHVCRMAYITFTDFPGMLPHPLSVFIRLRWLDGNTPEQAATEVRRYFRLTPDSTPTRPKR